MAGPELRVSMLLQANAGQAKAQVADLKGAFQDLGKSAREIGQGAGSAASPITAMGSATRATAADIARAIQGGGEWNAMLGMIRQAMNPLIAEHAALSDAMRDVTVAEDLGAISAREAALAFDQLQRAADRIEADLRSAGIALREIGPAAQVAETGIQQLINRTTGLGAATDQTVAASLRHGMMLDDIRAKFDPLFASSRRYELELNEIADAERMGALNAQTAAAARERAAQSMAVGVRQVGASAGAASAYMANLTAQGNDIMMMVAAGQNPLMLMMQQGTQVTQVFQQMRDSGMAIGPALASSLGQMVSPLSLVTMGVIALGAYGLQALMAMGEETIDFEDRLQSLNDVLASVKERVELLRDGNLGDTFGSMSDDVQKLTEALLELDRASSLTQLRDTFQTRMRELTEPSFMDRLNQGADAWGRGDAARAERDRSLRAQNFEELGAGISYDEFAAFGEQIAALASQGDVEAVTGKVSDLKEALAGGRPVMEMNEALRQLVTDLGETAIAAARVEAAFNDSALQKRDTRKLTEETAELRAQADLQQVIARYGDDSIQVVMARVMAERQATVAALETSYAAASTKEEFLAAWDAANGIASSPMEAVVTQASAAAEFLSDDLAAAWDMALGVAGTDMAGPISAAASAASGLAGFLERAATAAWDAAEGRVAAEEALSQMQREFSPGGQAQMNYGGRTPNAAQANLARDRNLDGTRKVRTRGGRGGGGAREEADEVQELIDRLTGELNLLQEMDPLQAKMLEHREALAGATDAQRAQVEELEASILREREALEAIEFAAGAAGDALIDALMGGKDAGEQLIQTLIRAVLQATLLGTGPLAGLFGGGGGGGGIGGLLGGLLGGITGKSEGGRILGPGTGTSDTAGLYALSNEEFVVKASAARKHLPLLEAINGDRPIGFMATGGRVGGGSSLPVAGGIARIAVDLSPDLQGRVLDQAADQSVLISTHTTRQYDRKVAPARQKETARRPRKVY